MQYLLTCFLICYGYADSDGIPLKSIDIMVHSTTLAKHLNSKNTYFLDFIERCLK